MPKNADEKRVKILDVAKKRFAHYRLAKTTMAEIAKDLAFSKALLYYYFPDKNSLFTAVIEDIIDEIDDEINNNITAQTSVEEGIYIILEKRIEYVKRYFYIIEYGLNKDISADLDQLLLTSFNKQKETIKFLLNRGVQNRELIEMDIEENANIFLNACRGMRLIVMKKLAANFLPTKEDFDAMLDLQKKLTVIFLRGLKS